MIYAQALYFLMLLLSIPAGAVLGVLVLMAMEMVSALLASAFRLVLDRVQNFRARRQSFSKTIRLSGIWKMGYQQENAAAAIAHARRTGYMTRSEAVAAIGYDPASAYGPGDSALPSPVFHLE